MLRAFALLASAQLADMLTTWYALAHGAHEANPATLAAVGFGGWAFAAFLKLGSVPATAALTWAAPDYARRPMLAGIRFVAAMIFGVALGNVVVTF